jgi:hypothetical protein
MASRAWSGAPPFALSFIINKYIVSCPLDRRDRNDPRVDKLSRRKEIGERERNFFPTPRKNPNQFFDFFFTIFHATFRLTLNVWKNLRAIPRHE